MKYHVNAKGNVGVCKATIACPFGGEESHFASKEIAQANYETLMGAKEFYNTANVFFHHLAITPELEVVLHDLTQVGNPLIVGGAVRDSLVNAVSKDIDIEVHGAELDAIAHMLKKKGYQVDEVGKQFGVLKVARRGVIDDLDISVPRRENLVGAHHRDFEVEIDSSMTVTEAAERRDFTFNALYYDANRKVLVDPHNGKQDFENKTLRHVSDKFAEDPLRVLRAMQFAARFDLTVSPETAKLAQSLRPTYQTLSKERVQEEWAKFLTKGRQHPLAGLKALEDSGWHDTEPGLEEVLQDKETLAKRLTNVVNDNEKNVIFGSAIIATDMKHENQENFVRTIVEGKKNQQRALDLLSTVNEPLETSSARKHLAYKLASRGFNFEDYSTYAKATQNASAVKTAKNAINEGLGKGPEMDFLAGKDVVARTTTKPGPWMGALLTEARNLQYENNFADKAEALKWLETKLETN